MTIMLAIDGGGTRTRCIAVDSGGRVRGEGKAGPSNHLQVTIEAAIAALRVATREALTAAGASVADVELVSAGLAGVDFDGVGAAEGVAMLRTIGFDRAVVHGDMVIAHRGALAGAPGVVALAGTGSSVLGIAADGTMIKAGGWGPVYGDQGSGYQLGRLGMVAAAEALDGSGATTALVEKLATALGVSAFRETVKCVYSEVPGHRRIAALAPVVDACAREGDEVAAAICRCAGADLARTVLAVVRRMRAQESVVSYQGTVLRRSAPMRSAFVDSVMSGDPGIEIRAPRFEPIAGAVFLGARETGWRVMLESLEIPSGV